MPIASSMRPSTSTGACARLLAAATLVANAVADARAVATPAWSTSLPAAVALDPPRSADGTEAITPARAWTILIYAAADNNADGHFMEFLNGVRASVADDPALELVVFIDRHRGFSNERFTFGEDFTGGRLYRMHAKSAERLAGGEEFPECTLDSEFEPDSADPTLLRKFLAFGKAHFPAPRTALLIYSHANGVVLCPDEETRTDMGIPELAQTVGAEQSVDWIALELCNMSGVEIAYQWSAFADGFSASVLTAIPNAGPPLDWRRIFARVHSPGHPAAAGRADLVDPATMTAADFGRLAIEEGERGRREAAASGGGGAAGAAHEAAATLDLDAVGAVKEAIDAFAVALWNEPDRDRARAALERLRDGDGTTPTVMNYVGGRFDGGASGVDLYALLDRACACPDFSEATRAAAAAARAATDAFVLASFGLEGYAGFEPGRHGVFFNFPAAPRRGIANLRRGDGPGIGWYSPLPFEHEGHHIGEWAWCRDGAIRGDATVQNWFELIDAWIDAEPGGGANGWEF